MLHRHRKAKEASDAKRKRCTTYHAKQGQRTSSDSTICKPVKEDEEKEICSICMDAIKCRGLLAVCNHFFCFHCIYEWSKMTNTCPLCKSRFRCISRINLESCSPEKQFRVKDCDQKLDQTAEDYELALELENDISALDDRDADYQMESENETNSSGSLISADADDLSDSFVTNDDSINYDSDSFDCYDDSFIDDDDSMQHPSNFSLASCLENVNKEYHFPYSLRKRTKSSEKTSQIHSSLNYSPMLTRSKFIKSQNMLTETRNQSEESTSHSMQSSQRSQQMQAENERISRNMRKATYNLPTERNSPNMQQQTSKEEEWATLKDNEMFSSSDDDMQVLNCRRRRKYLIQDDLLDIMKNNAFDSSTDDFDNEVLHHSDHDEAYHQKRNHVYHDHKFERKIVMTSQSEVTKDSAMGDSKSRKDALEIHSLDNSIFAEKENDRFANTLGYRSKLRMNPPNYKKEFINSDLPKRSVNRPNYKDNFICISDEESCFHVQSNCDHKNCLKEECSKQIDLKHKYEIENWDISSKKVISSKKKKRRLALSPNKSNIPCDDTPITLQCMSQPVVDTKEYCASSKLNGEKKGKANCQRTHTKKKVNEEKCFSSKGIKEVDISDSDTDEESTLTNMPRFRTIIRRKQNTRMPRYDF